MMSTSFLEGKGCPFNLGTLLGQTVGISGPAITRRFPCLSCINCACCKCHKKEWKCAATFPSGPSGPSVQLLVLVSHVLLPQPTKLPSSMTNGSYHPRCVGWKLGLDLVLVRLCLGSRSALILILTSPKVNLRQRKSEKIQETPESLQTLVN